MTKKIVAIGGGENGRILEDGSRTLYETQLMDEEIIKLSNKKILISCLLIMLCVSLKVFKKVIMKQ